MSDGITNARLRREYFSRRFSLSATAFQYDVDSNLSFFKSDAKGASTNYDATRGYQEGTRYNIRIKPETNPIWVQYNDADNDIIYVAGDEVFEDFNTELTNVYLTPADATTAQIDRCVCVAEDGAGNYESGGIGTYFKLYAREGTGFTETVFGVWFDTDDGSTQPTDSEVDTWIEVDVSDSDSADTIGSATATAIDAEDEFGATNTSGTVDITHATSGSRENALDVNTPCTISTQTEGAGGATTVNILVR